MSPRSTELASRKCWRPNRSTAGTPAVHPSRERGSPALEEIAKATSGEPSRLRFGLVLRAVVAFSILALRASITSGRRVLHTSPKRKREGSPSTVRPSEECRIGPRGVEQCSFQEAPLPGQRDTLVERGIHPVVRDSGVLGNLGNCAMKLPKPSGGRESPDSERSPGH